MAGETTVMAGRNKAGVGPAPGDPLGRIGSKILLLKRVALTVAILVGLTLLMGQARPTQATKVIEAERFVLRDARGAVRAEIGCADEGPDLSLLDEKGQRRARLTLSADGSLRVSVADKEGTNRTVLHVGPNGDSYEETPGKNGKTLASSSPAPQQSPRSREALGLYHRLCQRCHASDGSGSERRNRMGTLPDFRLASWQNSRSDAQLLASILTGRGTDMPAFEDRLTAAQARELVALVRAYSPNRAQSSSVGETDFDKRFNLLMKQLNDLRLQPREPGKQ